MKIFELLNASVPVGCVLAIFQPLLKTKRTHPVGLAPTSSLYAPILKKGADATVKH
jgi:hypothetical protein